MRIIDNIDAGLVVVIDWPVHNKTNYSGFDGKQVWPNSQWEDDNSDTQRSMNKILPSTISTVNFKPLTVKNGLVSLNVLDDVLKYKYNLDVQSRLLYLKFANYDSPDPEIIMRRFAFLGYDYGNFMTEDNYYSLIYHEIIDGRREEFKNYEKYLNNNQLFTSLGHISNLENTIEELKRKGENLEEESPGEEFQPVAVYSYNESN